MKFRKGALKIAILPTNKPGEPERDPTFGNLGRKVTLRGAIPIAFAICLWIFNVDDSI
ncbi:MAG: hypothetical protein WC054_10765 [Candidatus Nanopelagicales bacterium]